ncbi:hypothetical protein [Candidatus Nitrososphaera sp. FF02]|uniref:hypothetical protein n=1 Tax=Candidatus Nitrososphaera sp. FF02 TaxID=3398226 RepID=UPI0039E875FF
MQYVATASSRFFQKTYYLVGVLSYMRKNLILFLAIGASFSAFLITYVYSNIASAAEQEPINPDDSSFSIGSPKTAEELLSAGAKGYGEVTVKGPSGDVEASPVFQAERGGVWTYLLAFRIVQERLPLIPLR